MKEVAIWTAVFGYPIAGWAGLVVAVLLLLVAAMGKERCDG